MKNKKDISIKLKKVSIANFNYIKGGVTEPGETHTCTGPKLCPTTVDPRTGSFFINTGNC